jgi:hypothetical protein
MTDESTGATGEATPGTAADATRGAADEEAPGVATRIVISHPASLSDWGRDQLTAPRFVTYLRRVVDDVAVGDEWEEFVDVGCCGDAMDVPLRIEAIDGPPRVGESTAIEFAERDAEMRGGWAVQSAAGPDE